MQRIITHLVIYAVALWVAASLIPGINFPDNIQNIVIVTLIYGVINLLIKPIVKFFTCPFYVLTLGLFTFIVNALLLMLTSVVAPTAGAVYDVDGFTPALIGSVIVTLVSVILGFILVRDE